MIALLQEREHSMSRMELGQDEILETHGGFVDDGAVEGIRYVLALALSAGSSRFQTSPRSSSISNLGSIRHLSAIAAGKVLTINLHWLDSTAVGPESGALRSNRMPQFAKWSQ